MARVQCAASAWQFEATSVGNQANGQFSYVSYAHQKQRWGGENRETKLKTVAIFVLISKTNLFHHIVLGLALDSLLFNIL